MSRRTWLFDDLRQLFGVVRHLARDIRGFAGDCLCFRGFLVRELSFALLLCLLRNADDVRDLNDFRFVLLRAVHADLKLLRRYGALILQNAARFQM